MYLLQVLSQVDDGDTLSPSTIDEVERVLLARCGNDTRRDPIFNDTRRDSIFNDTRRDYMECVDGVERIVGQLRVDFSISTAPTSPPRSVCFGYCISCKACYYIYSKTAKVKRMWPPSSFN